MCYADTRADGDPAPDSDSGSDSNAASDSDSGSDSDKSPDANTRRAYADTGPGDTDSDTCHAGTGHQLLNENARSDW